MLVIRGGAIGDFILTLPAIAALRQQFPAVHLEVLGYAHIAQLALAGGIVDAVRSIESGPLAGFFARGGTLPPELCDYFASFAIIISYLYDPDHIFQTNVALCSRAQFIAGPHRPDEAVATPASEVFLQPLQRLAIFDADPVPRLRIEDPARSAAGGSDSLSSSGLAPRLAIHPGSGSESKNWPHQSWTELVRRIRDETNWQLLVVGGEAEGARLDSLLTGLSPTRAEAAKNLGLTELSQRLLSCRGFLGHDSGISHLAAAMGLAGVVLWGDSVEAVWRPPSPRIQIIRHPAGLTSIGVEAVLSAAKKLLGRP